MHTTTQLFKEALYHEVKSGVFYNKAAEITTNDESRMVFIELSDMEDDHIRHLIEKIEGTPFEPEFDPNSYVKELESSLEKTISLKESETLKKGDMKEVLAMAIGIEKQAAEIYKNLVEKELDEEVKELCRKLAKDEEEHLASMTQLLSSLDMDEEDRPSL